jgi:hypothetical protein
MKLRSSLAILGALLAIVGGVVAWRIHLSWREARDALVTAKAERTKAAAELKAQQSRLAAAQEAQRAARAGADAGQATSPAGNAGAAVPVMGAPRDHPELLARELVILKAGLAAKYGSLYRTLGLSAVQVAAFEDAIVEHEGRLLDLRAVELGRRVDPATAAIEKRITTDGRAVEVLVDGSIAALRREEEARFQRAQEKLLGEAGAAQWREFDGGAERRILVVELAGSLAFTPTPLSAEQGRRLHEILREGRYAPKLGADNVDWDAILRNAAGVLAPPQLAELQEFAARAKRDVAEQQLTRLARAARPKS